YDENNFPIDTVFTNDRGEFSFRKLPVDRTFTIRPLNLEEFAYEDMSIELNDNENHLNIAKTSDKASFFIIEEEGATQKEVVVAESNNILPKGAAREQDSMLFFAFNQYELSEGGIEKIEKLYSKMLADSSLEVVLIGHTDNVGSEEVNQRISILRANSAKNYL